MGDKHHASAVEMSHGWVACCETCRWIGGDHARNQKGEEAATRDAEMHERGERHPWEPGEIIPWTPDKRPFIGS